MNVNPYEVITLYHRIQEVEQAILANWDVLDFIDPEQIREYDTLVNRYEAMKEPA